jgi:hypothetical protein
MDTNGLVLFRSLRTMFGHKSSVVHHCIFGSLESEEDVLCVSGVFQMAIISGLQETWRKTKRRGDDALLGEVSALLYCTSFLGPTGGGEEDDPC